MNADTATMRIPPCSAQAIELDVGDELLIIDPEGQQVSDLVAFGRPDLGEYLSSGRSLDYAARLWLTTGNVPYSNRSLLDFARQVRADTRDLRPRDMIDIQSFMWVLGSAEYD